MDSKNNKIVFANVQLGKNSKIGSFNCIGVPKEQNLRNNFTKIKKVIIEDEVIICNHVVIYEGTHISKGCFIDDKIRIGYDCEIQNNTRITHGGYLCDRIKIGKECVIAGFICDAVEIGNNTTVMGSLVHEYANPSKQWYYGWR